MPIDASIAMGVKPFQLESPTNSLASILQIQNAQQSNQLNQMKMDEYKSGIADQNALRQIISGFGTDTAANQQALLKGGRLKEATEYAKGNADLAKSRGDAEFKQIETAHKRMDLMGQAFGFVKDNPTIENAFGAVDYLVSNGIMPAEAAAASKAKLQSNPSPDNIRALATQAFQSSLSAKDQLPVLGDFNAGATQQFTSRNRMTGQVTPTGSIAITEGVAERLRREQSAKDSAAGRAVTMRGQDMTNARALEANQSGKAPAGYRWAADGKSMEAISGGPADLKNSAASNQKVNEAKDVLSLLDEVDALLPKATGSLAGAGMDAVAGAVGYGTDGAASGAQLKALEGALISKMPKMSGPQSDKDVLLYKQMAGQIGDSTIPVNTRKAASKLIRKLNEKYAGVSNSGSLDSLLDKYK